MAVLKCLRCGGDMVYDGLDYERSTGVLPVTTDHYHCSLCGRIERFENNRQERGEVCFSHEDVQNKFCSHCQQCYDSQYPHCPWCGKG